MATLEILSSAVMPTPALRAPVVQMLIVNRLEIAPFVSVGKDMRYVGHMKHLEKILISMR